MAHNDPIPLFVIIFAWLTVSIGVFVILGPSLDTPEVLGYQLVIALTAPPVIILGLVIVMLPAWAYHESVDKLVNGEDMDAVDFLTLLGGGTW